MNKQRILGIIILILLIITGFWFYFSNKAKGFEMSGGVQEVNENIITVSGPVKVFSKDRVEDKTTDIIITPETILKKTVLYIEKKHIVQSGVSEPFTPIIKEEIGKIDDFKSGVKINYLKTNQNLFGKKDITALEIEYQVIEYEQ